MKSICLRRGWRHSRYAHLQIAAGRLADETEDQSVISGFLLAYAHHLNFYADAFYTDAMQADDVSPARPVVRHLVDRILGVEGNFDTVQAC